jgi:hypothetical protein
MVIEGIADQFGSGRQLQLVQETGSIGTDGLDAESEGLRDVLDGLAPGQQYEDFEFSLRQCVMGRTYGSLVQAPGHALSEGGSDIHAAC